MVLTIYVYRRYYWPGWLVSVSWTLQDTVASNTERRTELLLEKGYEVHGIIRRSSSFNTGRLHHLYADQHERA